MLKSTDIMIQQIKSICDITWIEGNNLLLLVSYTIFTNLHLNRVQIPCVIFRMIENHNKQQPNEKNNISTFY
jgi:hypothetical protein